MNIRPVITYPNARQFKTSIYKENSKKCGVYRWNNLITGKSYVGSSVNLTRRFSDYFCIDRFERIRIKGNSRINKAILKYKMSNFSLDILEYCDKKQIIEREQYYLDLIKPEYNILKTGRSNFSHKFSK